MKQVILFVVAVVSFIYPALSQVIVSGKSYTVEECIEAAKKEEEAGRIREATYFLNAAASYVWDLKDYDQAIALFNKSIELNQQINNVSGIAGINNNLGMLYFDKGDYEASLSYFRKTLVTRQALKNKEPVVSALINISTVLNKLKRYDEAIASAEDALLLAGEIDDKEQMRACYGMLWETYELKGDQRKLRQYFELYKSINDVIQKENELKTKTEVERTKYQAQLAEAERRNKELELALKSQQLAEARQELVEVDSANRKLLEETSKYELLLRTMEQQEQIKALEQQRLESKLKWERNARWYAVIGLLLSLGIAAVLFYAYKQNRRMNQMLKARNEQIVAQAKALKEENTVRTKLLSVISHDLRSPLSSVHLMVQLLKSNTFSPQKSQQYLTRLEDSLQGTFELLDNLLFWAKSQFNGINPTPEVFDFSKLVGESLNLLKASLVSKEIEVDVSHVGDEEVYADREITKLVLRNLLSNALKFSHPGGKITISTRVRGEMLEVAVQDNGIGIPKDKQRDVFTTKVKQNVGTSNEPSSGMGLVLCQDFVTKSGGHIWFESEEGKGSTFYFTLLLSKEE